MNWLDKLLVRIFFAKSNRQEQHRQLWALKIFVPIALAVAVAVAVFIYWTYHTKHFMR